jgi:hypothetical protein
MNASEVVGYVDAIGSGIFWCKKCADIEMPEYYKEHCDPIFGDTEFGYLPTCHICDEPIPVVIIEAKP